MKRRIFKNSYGVACFCVLLTATLFCSLFYQFYNLSRQEEIKARAAVVARSLDFAAFRTEAVAELTALWPDVRATLLRADGQVLYDSMGGVTENHLGRPEVVAALETGAGESLRFSESAQTQTYYYAYRLGNGSVLRLSMAVNEIYSVFWRLLPLLLLLLLAMFLLCLVLAKSTATAILKPLSSPVEEIPYEELRPIVQQFAAQKEKIARQDELLSYREAMVDSLTQHMAEGFMLLDRRQRVLALNPAAQGLLTPHQNAFIGQKLIYLTRNHTILEAVATAKAEGSGKSSFSYEDRYIELSASHIQGPKEGMVLLFYDRSESHRADKLRREFSSNVSHELKTPLTTVMGFAELVSCDMVAREDLPAVGGKIHKEAQRLLALIDDILLLSHLDEGAKGEKTAVSVEKSAQSALERLDPVAKEKGVTLALVGADVTVMAVESMLEEMIYNLCENGIKYNKTGGSVTITIEKDGLSVSDTGCGIAKAHLPRIFERFYRVDKSRSKKTGGTGLGLAIVRHIALYHGFSVDVKSVEGEGTTFVLGFNLGIFLKKPCKSLHK